MSPSLEVSADVWILTSLMHLMLKNFSLARWYVNMIGSYHCYTQDMFSIFNFYISVKMLCDETE